MAVGGNDMTEPVVKGITNSHPVPEVKLFKPSRNYFASIANNFAASGLVIPILERYPFQPSMPAYHPAIDSDYLIKKSYKGSYFFLAQSYRDEREFIELVRARALKRGLVEREKLQKELERRLEVQHWNEELRKSQEKTQLRFEITAERKREQTRVFFELLAVAYWKTRNFAESRVEVYDARKESTHDKFWEEVYKNLEKTPKETPLSGINKQSILMALPYAETQAGILRAFRRIGDNLLLSAAENIVERLAGNSVPGMLISHLTRTFHRTTYEKEIRQELKERIYQEALELRKQSVRKRDEDAIVQRKEQIESVEERVTQYWDVVEKLRGHILLPLSFNGTNEQALKNYLSYREASGIFYGLNAVKENKHKARAHQLLEHVAGIMPEILHLSNIRFVRSEWEEKVRPELKMQQTAEHSTIREYYQVAKKEMVHEYMDEKLSSVEKRVKDYWEARDKLHEELNLSLSSASTSLSEALNKTRSLPFTRVLTPMTRIDELKGNEPLDPINTKIRKSNMSFSQGWIDFYYEPKEPLPTPREPIKREFLAQHRDNVPKEFEFDYRWHHPFAYGSFWQLAPLPWANVMPPNSRDFSPYLPIESDRKVYDLSFDYEAKIHRPMPLPRLGLDEQPYTATPWEFQKADHVVIEDKKIDKTGIVFNRNRNDAQDTTIGFSLETNIAESSHAPVDNFYEEKRVFLQNLKNDGYYKSQQSFPIKFKYGSELVLAAHESQKEFLVHHFPLTGREVAFETAFKSKPQTVFKIDRLAPLGGEGTEWGFNQPKPMHFKHKFPKGK